MARARHLVSESGTAGERVDVWGSPDEAFVPPGVADYFASVLRADGDWLAEYPDPSSCIPQLTSRRLRNHQYNPVWGFLAGQSWVRQRRWPTPGAHGRPPPIGSPHRGGLNILQRRLPRAYDEWSCRRTG
jgi:hypothetical protein